VALDGRLLRADDRHRRPDCARLLEFPLTVLFDRVSNSVNDCFCECALRRDSDGCGLSPEILDQLLSGGLKLDDQMGANGLFVRLKMALIGRPLGAKLTDHLGYAKGDLAGRGSGNSRRGVSGKKAQPKMARSLSRCRATAPERSSLI
jgi:hypothetical protein